MPFSPITVDLHSHTRHSHAKDTAEDMAAAAFAKGLDMFGFSEHSPRPPAYRYPDDYREKIISGFPAYVAEVLAEKERYRGRMDVLLGVEMDYFPGEEAFTRETLAAHPFEYAIGSVHFQGLWGFDYNAADWAGVSETARAAVFTRYYRDQQRMAETGMFQIAGHPDLVKLFCKSSFDDWIATTAGRECVRAALTAMNDNGMAMEVSSAAIRKGLGEPYPGPAVMRMAYDMRLPISFGSDSHATADVAYGFDELAAYAHSFGYTSHAFFRNKAMHLRRFA